MTKQPKIPAHCALLKRQREMFDRWPQAKKYFRRKKVNKQALCLQIRFCDFRCSTAEVSRLKMASNEFNSLRKTFDNKIMTFPSALETLGRYCMK